MSFWYVSRCYIGPRLIAHGDKSVTGYVGGNNWSFHGTARSLRSQCIAHGQDELLWPCYVVYVLVLKLKSVTYLSGAFMTAAYSSARRQGRVWL